MARKIKVSNEVLKRLARDGSKRKVDARTIRIYYLIVTEGEKTEPNYFEGIKQDLPKGILNAVKIEIEGTGRNTQSLLDEALRLKEEFSKKSMLPIDRLWIVFDRDSFPAGDFNNAINRATALGIECAWSNEAFELWYLLHFHFYNTPSRRDEYQAHIEKNLRPFLGAEYRYRKNATDVYSILKKYGSVEDAIRHAKRLEASFAGHKNYADHNPCTLVYKLVAELLSYIPRDEGQG
jgi:hypothetical protein